MTTEHRMTSLERYMNYQRLLKYPMFNSIEYAEQYMQATADEFRRFVVRYPLGTYAVCYCFIHTDRNGNTKWVANEEFRFSHSDVMKYRNRAAHEVGLELVENM